VPKRNTIFTNNGYYHIYNRSSGNTAIFQDNKTSARFLSLLDFYRFSQRLRYSKYLVLPKEEKLMYEDNFRRQQPIVEIYSFCLMPNHYHLLLKQNEDNGVIMFTSNFQNGFAKYFNTKKERHGSLFQGPFKAKYIEKENYLLHLSRYIHLNPVISYIIDTKKLDSYPWTSFPLYMNTKLNEKNLVNTTFITRMLGSKQKYKEFVYNQANYQRQLKKIKDLTMETDSD
jgi:putative transposase